MFASHTLVNYYVVNELFLQSTAEPTPLSFAAITCDSNNEVSKQSGP